MMRLIKRIDGYILKRKIRYWNQEKASLEHYLEYSDINDIEAMEGLESYTQCLKILDSLSYLLYINQI